MNYVLNLCTKSILLFTFIMICTFMTHSGRNKVINDDDDYLFCIAQ